LRDDQPNLVVKPGNKNSVVIQTQGNLEPLNFLL